MGQETRTLSHWSPNWGLRRHQCHDQHNLLSPGLCELLGMEKHVGPSDCEVLMNATRPEGKNTWDGHSSHWKFSLSVFLLFLVLSICSSENFTIGFIIYKLHNLHNYTVDELLHQNEGLDQDFVETRMHLIFTLITIYIFFRFNSCDLHHWSTSFLKANILMYLRWRRSLPLSYLFQEIYVKTCKQHVSGHLMHLRLSVFELGK